MKFGGPEGFPQKRPESKDSEALKDLKRVADVLTERTAKLPSVPETANDNEEIANDSEKSEFGSPDLGSTIKKLTGTG